jgi:hypothetical protein
VRLPGATSRCLAALFVALLAVAALGFSTPSNASTSLSAGAGVATEDATMSVRAGSETLDVTDHAALRMTQRGVSIDAVENTLSQPSFQYFHEGVWKTGYYDPASRIFVGSVDGNVTTVINDVGPNYIKNLLAATP